MIDVRDALTRIPVIRFILHFDVRGGVNFGACGMSEGVAERLRSRGVIDVWLYKPVSASTNRWGHRKVARRYRKVSAGVHMPRLAALLREELRARNLGSINGLDDGHGRVALNADWRSRRAEVQAAALAAWDRLQAEQKEVA